MDYLEAQYAQLLRQSEVRRAHLRASRRALRKIRDCATAGTQWARIDVGSEKVLGSLNDRRAIVNTPHQVESEVMLNRSRAVLSTENSPIGSERDSDVDVGLKYNFSKQRRWLGESPLKRELQAEPELTGSDKSGTTHAPAKNSLEKSLLNAAKDAIEKNLPQTTDFLMLQAAIAHSMDNATAKTKDVGTMVLPKPEDALEPKLLTAAQNAINRGLNQTSEFLLLQAAIAHGWDKLPRTPKTNKKPVPMQASTSGREVQFANKTDPESKALEAIAEEHASIASAEKLASDFPTEPAKTSESTEAPTNLDDTTETKPMWYPV